MCDHAWLQNINFYRKYREKEFILGHRASENIVGMAWIQDKGMRQLATLHPDSVNGYMTARVQLIFFFLFDLVVQPM